MNEGTHARDRDPDEIERDIRRTRVSLGHTIDELENRLSPGELLDQAIGAARRHGGDFATNLGRSAENHPMPLLLTAVGIAWMMASANRPPPPARPRSERADADLSGRADEAKHRLRHGLDSAKSTASAVGDRASRARYAVGDTVSHTGERMRLQSRRMKDGFSHMLEEQPLLVGAMGIALGAALGAALPRSEAEDRLMGETSDAAARQVKDRAADAYDEVKHTADEMAASVQ
ncbi:MAG TPA: DUF3618 domain-containing protein, partial [Woeseiaceae bacterium]|nr:DUF3618 domain-containing protein [Woeseiaceae bacterium]